MNPGLNGIFENAREGYGYTLNLDHHERGWFGQSKPIFKFRLRHSRELQFVQVDGTIIRPAASFLTDGGSSPVVTHGWCDPFRFVGFLFHDSGYLNRGLTIKPAGEPRFRFISMTQGECDGLLRVMCQRDPILPCGRFKAWMIWSVLRSWGWIAWHRRDDRSRQKPRQGPPAPPGASVPVEGVYTRSLPFTGVGRDEALPVHG